MSSGSRGRARTSHAKWCGLARVGKSGFRCWAPVSEAVDDAALAAGALF